MEKLNNLIKAEKFIHLLQFKNFTGNNRNSIKAKVNDLLTKCYNDNISLEYLPIKYDNIKEIDVYKTSVNKGSVVVKYVNNYIFKEN